MTTEPEDMHSIVSLRSDCRIEVEHIGGKAAGLVRLLGADMPVPQAICVTADACRAHMARCGAAKKLESVGEVDMPESDVLQALQRVITDAELEPALQEALRSSLAAMGVDLWAVRSSATTEDLGSASFAGQHASVLAMESAGCAAALRQCWASLWTPQAWRYRRKQGFAAAEAAMATVVQVFVPARSAGVVFTADPRDGAADRLIVEAVHGLGEALVGGHVAPARFVVSKSGFKILEHDKGTQERLVVASPRRGVTWKQLGPAAADRTPLNLDEVRRIAWLACDIEAALGGPQDVEWALEGERFWILQARPLTTGGSTAAAETTRSPGSHGARAAAGAPSSMGVSRDAGAASPPGSAASVRGPGALPTAGAGVSNAGLAPRVTYAASFGTIDQSRQVWSNVNAGEVVPDVVTPMSWSVLREVETMIKRLFRRAGLDVGSNPLIGRIAGRLYFNLNTLAAVAGRFPGREGLDLEAAFGGTHLGDEERPLLEGLSIPPEDIPRVHGSIWTVLLRSPALLLWLMRHQSPGGRRYMTRLQRKRARLGGVELDTLGCVDLIGHIERIVEGTFDDHLLVYPSVGAGCFLGLQALCERWLRDRGLSNSLMAGCGQVCSADAGLALWALADAASADDTVRGVVSAPVRFSDVESRLEPFAAGQAFLQRWRQFMDEHGHHCRGEVELFNPRWSEQPDYLLDRVRSYVAMLPAKDTASEYRERAAERARLTQRCRQRLGPLRRRVFDAVLWRARDGLRLRESLKSEIIRHLALLRAALLELGGRWADDGLLSAPDDIFFLERDELARVEQRCTAFDSRETVSERRRDYDTERAMNPPPVVVGRPDELPESCAVPASGGVVFRGLPVSSGTATGPARVILHSDSEQNLEAGEILVAPFTDPGWTPYFLPAAGIVVDMGGLLSHGSIVAREYGIPAVVNVGPATKVIRTGQIVHVDANAGVVRVLDAGQRP